MGRRLRRRRRKTTRHPRHRLRHPWRLFGPLLGVALAVGIYRGGQALLNAPYLSIRKVQVVGGPSSVFTASGLTRGEPILTVNFARARRRLLAADPWYARASFRAQLPDEVIITVTRRTPLLLIGTAAGQVMGIDETGMILPEGRGVSGLPYLTGINVAGAPYTRPRRPGIQMALDLVPLLPGPLLKQVSEVSVGGGGLSLYLESGTKVILGPDAELPRKVAVLEGILRQAKSQGMRLVTIDVTYPGTPDVTTGP